MQKNESYSIPRQSSKLPIFTSHEPLKLISWQKAITLLTPGKVEVVEEYDRDVHSMSFSIKLPAVVRLLRFVKWRDKTVKFSQHTIYERDRGTCRYYGQTLLQQELIFFVDTIKQRIAASVRQRSL